MARNLLIAVFVLIINTCFGQNDWRPGYILNIQGDTIPGYLDYRNGQSNSKQCFFRKEIKGEIQQYSPRNIIAYRFINDKYYVSKKINEAESDSTVFLEFLIEGKANIYSLRGVNDRFFLEKDGNIYELKNTSKVEQIDGRNYMKNKNEFRGTLTYLLQDAEMQGEINNSILSEKSLIKIARDYHVRICKDDNCIVYKKSLKPVKITFGLILGINNSDWDLLKQWENGAFMYYYRYKPANNFTGGVSITFSNIPLIYERYSFRVEIQPNSYYHRIENEQIKKVNRLNIPVLFEYKILPKNLYPVVELGLSNYFGWSKDFNNFQIRYLAGIRFHYNYYRDNGVSLGLRFETGRTTIYGNHSTVSVLSVLAGTYF